MLSGAMGSITHMTLVQVLVFSALIVAVDPVAVSCRFPFPQSTLFFPQFSLHRLLFSFSTVREAVAFMHMHVCVCVCVSLAYMSDMCMSMS